MSVWPFAPKKADGIPGGYPPGAEPFLSAIVADRADDTARLVFADWLQENDDEERAEFIRLQCELHHFNPHFALPAIHDAFAPEVRAKFDRQVELLYRNAPVWTAGFARGMLPLADAPFARGFPRAVNATPAQWREHGARVRAWVPVETVYVLAEADRYPDLMTAPTLFGLDELTLTRASTDELRALANSPALDSLTAFNVFGRDSDGTVEVPALRALFGSPRLARLHHLYADLDRAGDTLGFVVGGSPHLRNLRTLHLTDGMRDEAARDLFDSPNLANVIDLQLTENPIGDVAIRGLVRSKYLTQLANLELSYAALTAESGRLLAAWPGLRTVVRLGLGGNDLGLDGLRVLSESPHFERLESLRVSGNIEAGQVKAVRALPGFAHIKLF